MSMNLVAYAVAGSTRESLSRTKDGWGLVKPHLSDSFTRVSVAVGEHITRAWKPQKPGVTHPTDNRSRNANKVHWEVDSTDEQYQTRRLEHRVLSREENLFRLSPP